MMRGMAQVLDIDQLSAEYDDVYGDADRAEWDEFVAALEADRYETELRWWYEWDDVMTHDRAGYLI